MNHHKILIIEDDADVRELVKTALALKDFDVAETGTGQQGISLCQSENPDVLILDLMLPDIDGMTVCESLKRDRKTASIPILMLTARSSPVDRVKGLESGADDYLVKPFDTLELLARVKVLLRRKGDGEGKIPLMINEFEIDPASYKLTIAGNPITNLTPKEFEILYFLMKHSPNPVSREEIYKEIWGMDGNPLTRVVDIHIVKIRRKIGTQYSTRIKTIPAKGYLFSAA